MMSSLTLHIESPSDFKMARIALDKYSQKINETNKLTKFCPSTQRWLVGNSIVTKEHFIINFMFASKHKEQAEHGYLEFINQL